jgi:hypothetical protein
MENFLQNLQFFQLFAILVPFRTFIFLDNLIKWSYIIRSRGLKSADQVVEFSRCSCPGSFSPEDSNGIPLAKSRLDDTHSAGFLPSNKKT